MGFSVFTSGFPITAVPAGNQWGIDITGATPYKLVGENEDAPWGVHYDYPNMGATDANGNYSYRGMLADAQKGTWHSKWLVDGQLVGEYYLTVIPTDYTGPSYGIAKPQVLSTPAAAAPAPTFEQIGQTLVEKGVIGPGTAPAQVPQETTVADLQPGAVLSTVTQHSRAKGHPEFIGAPIGVVIGVGGPIGIVVGIIAIIGSILGGLFGGLFGGQDWGKQIGQIRAQVVNLGNAIGVDLNQVHRWVAKILDFLQGVFVGIIHAAIDLLKKVIDLIKRLVTEIIPNILKAIQRIRQKIIDIYQRLIRPLIIIIQRIRQVLAILKLFHIKWAAKLDATLAQLQSKLMAPIFFLLKYTNLVANYLNLILTARLILQKGLFLNSLKAYMGSSLAMMYGAQSAALTDADNQAIAAAQKIPTTHESEEAARAAIFYNSGPYQPLITQARSDLITFLQEGL